MQRSFPEFILPRPRMVSWRAISTGIALLAFFAFGPERLAHAADPPNIIFILLDDLGVGELQWYPDQGDLSLVTPSTSDIQTPQLFALAEQGMRFTGYYTNGPVCSPTRAAILTGR